ncbi:hypothetical protein OUZ56_027783 [Daphnia magna]|uniref:Uncharacterized protein n=1 Tax=Daphnia magna TaxID=35525 RepID=A0ABR0B1X1_9CRUS|nr:hypothetical protein OUZ56_027783 [Daphnia magna]
MFRHSSMELFVPFFPSAFVLEYHKEAEEIIEGGGYTGLGESKMSGLYGRVTLKFNSLTLACCTGESQPEYKKRDVINNKRVNGFFTLPSLAKDFSFFFFASSPAPLYVCVVPRECRGSSRWSRLLIQPSWDGKGHSSFLPSRGAHSFLHDALMFDLPEMVDSKGHPRLDNGTSTTGKIVSAKAILSALQIYKAISI